MRIRLRGINCKRKKLAGGSFKTYYWAWKGGPPLQGEPGTPEFQASYNAAVAAKVTPPTGVLLKLLQDYQASDQFRSRRDRTRHDYVQQIRRIERDLGDFPLRCTGIFRGCAGGQSADRHDSDCLHHIRRSGPTRAGGKPSSARRQHNGDVADWTRDTRKMHRAVP
jgi:hypothetical protein